MRALVLCAMLVIAGCTHSTLSSRSPDTGYTNQSKWQMQNDEIQKACVLRIIEIAPPTATAEELDYNLLMCLLRNDAFI